jgi:hypothetical protein
VRYIDSVARNRDGDGRRLGLESICAQLTELGATIAPSTYYEHRDRPATAREVRDADLEPQVTQRISRTTASMGPGRFGGPSTENAPVGRRSHAAPSSD